MWRIVACLVVVFLVGTAGAQPPPSQPATTAPTATLAAPAADADRPTTTIAWGVAIIGTLVILSIVCLPSRKS